MPNLSPTQSSTTSSTPHNQMYTKQHSKSLLRLAGMIRPSSNLKIHLVEPILFIRGSPQESMGCFLRGELCLNLSKQTKIKRIEMKFIGRLKTFWPEGKISYNSNSNNNDLCEKREIITHSWTFLAPNVSSAQHHLLPTGVHTYPFELFLPGDIPETIEASRGSISYKLVASVVRQGFSSNINAIQYVPIVRAPLNEQNSEGISVSSMKESLSYEISIPKRAYVVGDTIEIDMKLRPMIKNLSVIGAKIQLNEEATYKSGTQKYRETKSLCSLKVKDYEEQRPFSERKDEDDPDNDALEDESFIITESVSSEEEDECVYYQKCISFPIPKCTNHTHYSCKSSIIMAHKLKFTFTTSELLNTGILKRRKKVEIKVEVPVMLFPYECASDELPTYEEGGCPEDNGNHFRENLDGDGEIRSLNGDYMSERNEGTWINDPFRFERLAMGLPPSYDFH